MTFRLALAGFLAVCAGTASAQQSDRAASAPSITVEGQASEAVLPDKAILSFGVVTERPGARDASTENGKAVQAVIEAVKAGGIEPRAIQSTSVSLEPLFRESPTDARTITGFRASNQLEVEVSPPGKAGLLAGELIDKGVNTIDGIRFASTSDDERTDRLRGLAMRDARHRAEIYVGALGLKLGRTLGISPVEPGGAPPFHGLAKSARAAAMAVPLEAGQQTATESVSITWEIVQ